MLGQSSICGCRVYSAKAGGRQDTKATNANPPRVVYSHNLRSAHVFEELRGPSATNGRCLDPATVLLLLPALAVQSPPLLLLDCGAISWGPLLTGEETALLDITSWARTRHCGSVAELVCCRA